MARLGNNFDVGWHGFRGYDGLTIKAGCRGQQTIVPPAGEDYSFTVDMWARTVEVSVSPTGRSVRVWVDGAEVYTETSGSKESFRTVEVNAFELIWLRLAEIGARMRECLECRCDDGSCPFCEAVYDWDAAVGDLSDA